MKQLHGLWVPDAEEHSTAVVIRHLQDLRLILRHFIGRGTCVQAGGFVGQVPMVLGKLFERVITFEPHPESHACLKRNVVRGNVEIRNEALWDWPGELAMSADRPDMGMAQMVPGYGVRARMLDDLGLEQCDLLWLDVEGAEIRALRGAWQTVALCLPVIVVEEADHQLGHGDPLDTPKAWLEQRGYRRIDRVHKDTVYIYRARGG